MTCLRLVLLLLIILALCLLGLWALTQPVVLPPLPMPVRGVCV